MVNTELSLKSTIVFFLLIGSLIIGTNVKGQGTIPTIDGDIGVDEYKFDLSFKDGKFLFSWKVVDDEIYIGMSASTTNYIGINIDPGVILTDADLLYGFVNPTGAFMIDTYSPDWNGPPKLDTDDGGTDDILEYSGKEEGGKTTFEFRRLLITGDSSHDNDIVLKNTLISWTIGPSDNFRDSRDDSGRVEINFLTGNSKEVKDYTLYYIAGGAVIVLVAIILLVRFIIKRRRSSKLIDRTD